MTSWQDQKVTLTSANLDEAKARELEQKFDSEVRFRSLAPAADWLIGGLLIVLSLFHYYTAGFGLLQETVHRGIHLSSCWRWFSRFPHQQARL